MDKIRVSAKTKDEAVTKALIQLGTTSDRLGFNVLVQGSNGLFGIGAKPWIIEAFVKEEDESISKLEEEVKNITSGKLPAEENKPQAAPEKKKEAAAEKKADAVTEEKAATAEEAPVKEEKPAEEKPKREYRERKERPQRADKKFSRGGYDPIVAPAPVAEEKPKREIKPISEEEAQLVSEKAITFLTSVLGGMKMEVNVSSSFQHEMNELMINLEGPDMGILIGKRGQTLDSLQYLCSLVVNKEHKDDYIRVKLDTEDYRKRREQTLRNLARNIAYKVKRTHKAVSLEPMNPYERRIIHAALQNDRYATTKSEGEEPFRHIVVVPKPGTEKTGRYGGNRSYGNRNGGYRGKGGYRRDNRDTKDQRKTENKTEEA